MSRFARTPLMGIAAALVCAALAKTTHADLRVIEPAATPGTSFFEMAPAGDGGLWLLRRHDPVSGSRRTTVLKLSPDLETEREWELPPGAYGGIAAFGSGFLVAARPQHERTGPNVRQAYELQSFEPRADARPRRLYTWTTDGNAGKRFAPASATRVYVVETPYSPAEHRHYSSLSMVDADGRRLWRYELGDRSFRALTAVRDGVMIAMSPLEPRHLDDRHAAQISLTEVGSDGELRWQSDFELGGGLGQMLYLAPDWLAMTWSTAAGDGLAELLNLDTHETRRLELPTGYGLRLRAVPDGLLVAATLVWQPYLALHTVDGERVWWRRFKVSPGPRYDRRRS